MLTTVIFSPVYIKKVAMIALEKLKSVFHTKNLDVAEKVVNEAEVILEQDPDLKK